MTTRESPDGQATAAAAGETGSMESTLAAPDIHRAWEKDYLGAENDRFFDLAFDEIARITSPAEGATILDAGCGTGAHAMRLARRGFRVVAVDLSAAVIDIATHACAASPLRDRIEFRQDNLCALSFPDRSFRYVLCWGVLMHIHDVGRALDELCRVVDENGWLIVGENNRRSLDAWWYALRTWWRTGRRPGISTAAGVEHRGESSTGPVLYRDADIAWIAARIRSNGLVVRKRLPRQFSELYVDASSGAARTLIIRFNNAWFRFVRLPHLAFGNLLFAQKLAHGRADGR